MTRSPNSAPNTSPNRSTGRSPWLLVLVFRLLLLGVGSGISLILGILFAIIYPNPNPEKPLLPKILKPLDNQKPTISPNSNSTPKSTPENLTSQLTTSQRQEAQTKLRQLQAQQQSLRGGILQLEKEIGVSAQDEALEARLETISLQLQAQQASGSDTSSGATGSINQTAASSQTISSADKLKVTLPSDVLFEENSSTLRPDAGLILDKIVADLRKTPKSTIRIAVHTKVAAKAQENRKLSFSRAKAVEQYLASALDDQYRWLVVGYGETRPLVSNDTDANGRRNRRVEISVD
ncbi:MAG: OmpA family protein [Symploca sp. SIO2E9]|nr:OmpA family protein [Symploca sp. SIO2E9]